MLLPAVAVVAAIFLGLTAAFGGFAQAADPVERLGAGAVLDQGRFRTRFVEAVYTLVRPKNTYEEETRRLELVFEVTNLGDETASVGVAPDPGKSSLGGSFAASIQSTVPPIKTEWGGLGHVVTGDVESNQLHPGITSKVVIRYEPEKGFEVPDRIIMNVGAFEYQSESFFLAPDWFTITREVDGKLVPTTFAIVTLPVRQEVA